MNWDAISAVSGFISSIAVVSSVIYLGLQIRQSNKLAHGQTRSELRHMAQTEINQLMNHPDVFQAQYREQLTETDRIKLHQYLMSAMRFREFVWRQHALGLLDDSTARNYMQPVLQLLGPERNRRWWNRFTDKTGVFDPAFVLLVDNMLKKNPAIDPRELIKDL